MAAERTQPRQPLTRDRITAATAALAAKRGLPAVSMRAVASALDVTPMALYRHVSNKQELLDALVERILLELPLPDPDEPWERRLRELAAGMRATARRHPDIFGLLFQRLAITPAALGPREVVYVALRDAGVPERLVPRAERLFSTFVLGYAAGEAGGRFAVDGSADVDGDFAWAQDLVFAQIRALGG